MRLLQKTIRSYLGYSVCLLLVTIPVSYFAVGVAVRADTDEHLVATRTIAQRKILQAIRSGALSGISFADQDVSLRPSDNPRSFERFINRDIYDSVIGEVVPRRILQTNFLADGKPYLLQVTDSMVDRDNLILSIVLVQSILLVLLLVGLLLINWRLARNIWNPFYKSLERLRQYRLDQPQPLALDRSTVNEFNDLNRSLWELTERARSTYLAQKEFTGNASHEIQTPLAIFQTKLELLMQTNPLNEEQAGLIGDLEGASQRLARLHRSLILLTRIDNQQFPDTEPIGLKAVVIKCLASMNVQSVSVETDFRDDPLVVANRSLVEVLVGNLVHNAWRHNIAGGLVRVTIRDRELVIQNTGKNGPLDSDRIFQRFYKESTDPGSLGLGLPIVRQIGTLYGWETSYAYIGGLHSFRLGISPNG